MLQVAQVAKKAASAMLHRNLAKGINGWRAMVTERQRRLAALKSAASSFLNRALQKGINGWKAMVAEKKASAMVAKHQAAAATRVQAAHRAKAARRSSLPGNKVRDRQQRSLPSRIPPPPPRALSPSLSRWPLMAPVFTAYFFG